MRDPAAELRKLILQFADSSQPNGVDHTAAFRSALLDYGSHTPDNVAAIERIEIGPLEDETSAQTTGLRLASTGASLATILNVLEDAPIPPAVAESLPNLTPDDYESALRVVTLLLTAIENRSTPTPR